MLEINPRCVLQRGARWGWMRRPGNPSLVIPAKAGIALRFHRIFDGELTHPCAGEKESASCRFPQRGLSSPARRRAGSRLSGGPSRPALGTLAALTPAHQL